MRTLRPSRRAYRLDQAPFRWRAASPSGRSRAGAIKAPASRSLRRYIDAMAEPDADNPQGRENSTEKVHHGDDSAGRDNQCLQHAAPDDRPPQPPARRDGERDRRHGEHRAGDARPAGRRVLDRERDRDRQPDHDRLHDQHRGAEPLHQGVSSARVRSAGADPVSSSLASPAVITDPAMSTTAVPGGPPPAASRASASSASATPISIASSSLGTARTRSGPNTAAAISASFPGSADLGEELPVTTSSDATGSSSSRIPGTSLSSLTARMATSSVNVKASDRAATVAAIPAGLCAASTMTSGLRRTTSSRPGDDIIANADRTSSTSSAAGCACPGGTLCSPGTPR